MQRCTGAPPLSGDGGHAVDPPVFGGLGDHGVDRLAIRLHAGDEAAGEVAELRLLEPPVEEPVDVRLGEPGILLDLVEHLQGDLTPAGPALNSTCSTCSTPSGFSVTSCDARILLPSLTLILTFCPA